MLFSPLCVERKLSVVHVKPASSCGFFPYIACDVCETLKGNEIFHPIHFQKIVRTDEACLPAIVSQIVSRNSLAVSTESIFGWEEKHKDCCFTKWAISFYRYSLCNPLLKLISDIGKTFLFPSLIF